MSAWHKTLKEYKKPARYSSDILIYSGEESSFIESTASLVQPRGWHKMVQIGENILILGGCYQVKFNTIVYNETQ